VSAYVPAHIRTNAHEVQTTALLDTGANTRSYIGKAFLEAQLATATRTPVKRSVRLGGSETTLAVDSAVMLPVTLSSPKGSKHSALLTFDVIDTDIQLIVGLPDLCLHFAGLVHDVLLAIGSKLSTRLEAPKLLSLASVDDPALTDQGASSTQAVLHPPWLTAYQPPPEEEEPGLQPSIFPEVPDYDERLAAFQATVPTRIYSTDPKEKADLLQILLLPRYAEIFAWRRWKFISGVPKIKLNWKQGMPAFNPAAPRPCAVPKQVAAAHSIKRFVEQGFWASAGISPKYATPVVLVWKPDKSIRICADYTSFVNRWLAPFEAPAPLIHLELERLSKYPRFINVDIKDAFYTLGLDPSDSEKLVVATHLGYFKPLSVPMGITVGSALLQLVAQIVFAPLAHRSVILQDNVIVGLMPDDDPRAVLTQLLELCVKHSVTLAISKCEICTSSTVFWGYLLQHGRYSIDPIRRQGIDAIPIPASLKHAQRFCGFANFFAPFIDKYRDKAEPILAMLRPKYDFNAHAADTITAFADLKHALVTCHALFMARRDLGPWILRCDASNLGVAAVLLQRCPLTDPGAIGSAAQEEDGVQLQPIAMVSVPLTESARTKWSTHTSELYAIVQGCKRLATMIDGHPIIVETDHRNLLFAQQNHAALTARWIAYLQSNFNIVAVLHRPGVRNTLADTLSRLYVITEIDAAAHLQAYSTAAEAVSNIASSHTIRDDCYRDAVASLVMLCDADADSIFSSEQHLSLGGPRGEVLSNTEEGSNRLTDAHVVPVPDQGQRIKLDEAFATVHNARAGHVGWKRTYERLKSSYPAIQFSSHAVKALVDNCATCQKFRTQSTAHATEVLHSIPMPTASGLVSADTFKLPTDVHGMTHVLVIVNHGTKMTDLQAMPAKTSAEVCRALFSHFCREGVPSLVLTDPGTELHNADVAALMQWLNIKHGLSLVKRPQGHATERTIGKTKLYLAILLGAENALAKWSDKTILPAAMYFLNSNFNQEVGCAPMQLRFGSQQYACFRRLAEAPAPDEAPALLADIDTAFKAMQARADTIQASEKAHRRQKGAQPADQHVFQPGDFVYWQSDALLRPHGSLTAWYLGPFEVLQQDKYTVRARHMSSGREVSLHHSRCRICTTTREVALELSRQDHPDEHTLTRILNHKGSLLDRSSLTFEAVFADGDTRWLSWAAVRTTEALHLYAARFQCTRILLAEDLAATQARLAAPRLTASHIVEGIQLPAVGTSTYVSYYAFPATLDTALAQDATEYCLHAKIAKITTKRIDITFAVIPGLTVAWSLLQYAAFCSPTLSPAQQLLDNDVIHRHSGLGTALGAPRPTEPIVVACRVTPTRTTDMTNSDTSLQARLADNSWRDIVVQTRKGNKLNAYVPSLDIEIEVPLSRTRPRKP
jgi:hypothetical protein